MHRVFFFKVILNMINQGRFSEAEVQKYYDQEAGRFQAAYNKKHKKHPIKEHGRRLKKSIWFVNGETVTIFTSVIRFSLINDSGRRETFTFLGSMFVSRSKYSKQFMLTALGKGEAARDAKAETSQTTLQKWRNALKRQLNAIPFKTVIQVFECMLKRNPANEPKNASAITDFFLVERRLFPLSYLNA